MEPGPFQSHNPAQCTGCGPQCQGRDRDPRTHCPGLEQMIRKGDSRTGNNHAKRDRPMKPPLPKFRVPRGGLAPCLPEWSWQSPGAFGPALPWPRPNGSGPAKFSKEGGFPLLAAKAVLAPQRETPSFGSTCCRKPKRTWNNGRSNGPRGENVKLLPFCAQAPFSRNWNVRAPGPGSVPPLATLEGWCQRPSANKQAPPKTCHRPWPPLAA